MISAQTELIAVGCNSTAHALDWVGSTVAYGAGNFIALYRPEEAAVHLTLRGHRERVNCVRFAHGTEQSVLITGSVDKTARVWMEGQPGDWQCIAELVGHKEAIEAVAGAAGTKKLTAVTAGTDGTIRVFQVDLSHGELQQVEAGQVIEMGVHTALSLDLAQLDTTQLLCAGSTDSKVHVFVQRSGKFERAAKLAGHSGWTTSVAAMQVGTESLARGATAHWRAGDVIVASGSHDRMVRLWRISRTREAQATGLQAQLDAAARGDELTLQEQTFAAEGRLYAATTDAVLAGHEGRVHGVRWQGDGRLASASADGSAMVWGADSVWVAQARLGDANGTRALLGVAWGDGSLVAYGIRGSLHAWTQRGTRWEPQAAPSGHAGGVQDISWEPQGRYVLSVGLDQTARLYAQWRSSGWHEAARPQTHGHDMRRAAFVTPLMYVAAADEKVARVLKATQQFADLSAFWEGASIEGAGEEALASLGAAQPALGLSNRAAAGPEQDAPVDGAVPVEEQLQRRLWPEAEKLYGHPNDLLAVAAARNGRWVASSCRAARPHHAAIRIVGTDTWQPQPAPLAIHTLSVTALRFSPDDRFLLSAGRDRSWALSTAQDPASGPFQLLLHRSSAHARIIWDVAWSPDSRFFATASRDKSVKLWQVPDASSPPADPVVLAFPEPVTAIDFAPQEQGPMMLAAALESGRVFVLRAQSSEVPPRAWAPAEIPPSLMHGAAVRRVAWQPVHDSDPSPQSWLLASASDDHTVRLTRISF
ncbi:Elongator subunit elp2 [Coemansia brasiliensis]|uniref:Elongator complex protein 2 n=1 Tax=Coemansia brasiliensis TaxID=2650707 RepID=A0A9W8LYD6_9FUNG|nr:Elongator subunit elp2 [Coemansia brasiliensis]